MSTDTEVHDPFEAELAARMGAATEAVTASGVTRDGVDERLAARRASRRRRQGGLLVAAAALVVAAGIGALVTAGGEPQTSVEADQAGTTEAPTTVAPAPTTTEVPSTECAPTTVPASGATGGCVPTPSTTAPPTTVAPQTSPVPTDPAPPETTAPPATEPPTTEAPTTTAPALVPGQPCTLGSDRDCIDPEADGTGVYLLGGGDCMAAIGPDADGMTGGCDDLDGDGYAGYPDSEGQ
jgi:hypothetical protein